MLAEQREFLRGLAVPAGPWAGDADAAEGSRPDRAADEEARAGE